MRRYIAGAVLFCCGMLTAALAQPTIPCPQSCAPPPTRGMRVAAEWEPVIGVLIGWPLQLPRELVCQMARDVDVYVTVRSDRARDQAASQFQKWGIDPRRVRFMVTRQGTGYYLPRDWGPFAAFDPAGKCRLVDGQLLDYPLGGLAGHGFVSLRRLFRLNYRRDDQAPAALAPLVGVERQELPIALTGGNVHFDGHGTGFASDLLLGENLAMGVSEEQFRCLLQRQLGVNCFHFLPNFERIGIQHVDCLFKLLDEERILVKRTPENHPSHPHVEKVVEHLRRLTNVRGRPYQILRIETPRHFLHKLASYTNSLIVNRKVYVPLFNIDADTAALETWRRAMPGYEVMGFPYNGWSFTDALHCRVRGVWDPGMLYMSHHRPVCQVPSDRDVKLDVQIRDYSGAGLLAEGLTLSWRVRGNAQWQVVPLQPTATPDTYQVVLSRLDPGQTIEYYFSAASASGRRETMPRTAPNAAYAVSLR